MTRCLNCGAARDAEPCESCGLTALAAELLLRRRLLNRSAFFVLGALAFLVAGGWYPPLELDGMLIFVGVVFFFTLGLAVWVERRAARQGDVEVAKRVFYGLVPVPWLLALLLFLNGGLDRSAPQNHAASVIGKFAISAPLPVRRLVVTSWREGRQIERVAVDRDDFNRFHPGDAINVRVEGGLVGIPWVYGVSRR
jgi:4-amino-4-deoxy-L-arabinose transferase-like glycosyltransferase